MKRLHLILFSISFVIILACFTASIIFWNALPSQIPTHFGITGAPDAWSEKSLWYVFMLPTLNLLMGLFFVFVYKKPQYSSWPTTITLMTVEIKKREKIFEILRSMNAWVFFIVTIMFSYLDYVTIATATGQQFGLEKYIMIGFLVILFALIFLINFRMYKTVKDIMKEERAESN